MFVLGSNSARFHCRSRPLNRLGLYFSATSLQSPPDTLTSNLRQARLIPRVPSYHRSRNSLSDLGTISNSVCERVAVKPRLSRQTHHPAGALSYQLPNQSAIAYLIARLGYVGATAFSASRKLLTPIIVIIPRQRRQLAAQAQQTEESFDIATRRLGSSSASNLAGHFCGVTQTQNSTRRG